jgi:hypothetical protein
MAWCLIKRRTNFIFFDLCRNVAYSYQPTERYSILHALSSPAPSLSRTAERSTVTALGSCSGGSRWFPVRSSVRCSHSEERPICECPRADGRIAPRVDKDSVLPNPLPFTGLSTYHKEAQAVETVTWRLVCQPLSPATLYPQEDSWNTSLLGAVSTPGQCPAARITLSGKSNDLIWNRTRDLPACSTGLNPLRCCGSYRPTLSGQTLTRSQPLRGVQPAPCTNCLCPVRRSLPWSTT